MLLQVKNIQQYFPIRQGVFSRIAGYVKAVDGVSFSIERNEVHGLVGESGCGKTTVARCVLRLIEPTEGSVVFQQQQILQLNNRDMNSIRKKMQVIFQDPLSSLNPRMRVENILEEPMVIHRLYPAEIRKKKVRELLNLTGLPSSAAGRYPHEFSGGQCQRIGIARALALEPMLIIADEPVSALDVSIQAQIINLMQDLKDELGLSYLFISHDLSVVQHVSDRISVMYLGKIVESGTSEEVCFSPLHPYTKALLSVVPEPVVGKSKERIILRGDVPSPSNPPPGCAFHTRCPIAKDDCQREIPELQERDNGRMVRCPFV